MYIRKFRATFWEGAPFLITLASQCLFFLSSRYRYDISTVAPFTPEDRFDCFVVSLIIFILLLVASAALFAARRRWPDDSNPARSFPFAFFCAMATFLTFAAILLLYLFPFLIGLGQDGRWQEIQRNST
jgi:cytochrome bd-type quinol oxidase subunit 2